MSNIGWHYRKLGKTDIEQLAYVIGYTHKDLVISCFLHSTGYLYLKESTSSLDTNKWESISVNKAKLLATIWIGTESLSSMEPMLWQ